MNKPKRKTISEYLAERIVRNQMRVRFSHAHEDFLQEQYMSNSTVNMNGSDAQLDGSRQAKGNPSDGKKMNGAPSADSINSGMTVGSVVPVSVKYVGAKELDGKRGGDTRVKAAPAVLPQNPGPREPKGQSKVMSSKLDSPAPQLSDTEGSEGERA